MKNTYGQSVALTIFGESHGPAVGVVLDGLAPGLPVDEDLIRRQLSFHGAGYSPAGEGCVSDTERRLAGPHHRDAHCHCNSE